MLMNEQNRTSFLNEIASQLGREMRKVPAADSKPVNTYPQTRLTEKSLDELCQEFLDFH